MDFVRCVFYLYLELVWFAVAQYIAVSLLLGLVSLLPGWKSNWVAL